MQTYILVLDVALQLAVAALWCLWREHEYRLAQASRYGTRIIRHKRRKGDRT